MTAANVRARMIHRATVERDAATDTNAYGHAGPPDWQALDDPLVCFFYTSRGREAVTAERTAVVDELALLAPLGSDVSERDRINGIEDRAGNSVQSGVLNIRSVLRHHTHLELLLESAA